jgi:hypothetical protein
MQVALVRRRGWTRPRQLAGRVREGRFTPPEHACQVAERRAPVAFRASAGGAREAECAHQLVGLLLGLPTAPSA